VDTALVCRCAVDWDPEDPPVCLDPDEPPVCFDPEGVVPEGGLRAAVACGDAAVVAVVVVLLDCDVVSDLACSSLALAEARLAAASSTAA
jgi:hypothetical protein